MKGKYKIREILLPLLIYLSISVGVPFAWWCEKLPSSELLVSTVVLKGCYEGTMNHATLKLRADSTFEIQWTGAFLSDTWNYGRYRSSGDTITFINKGKPITPLNDTLIIIDTFNTRFFVPYKDRYTSVFRNTWFYFGDCRGYN